MNTILALIAVIGGALGSLVAFKIVPLDKFISPAEADTWYDKFGGITKIVFPSVLLIGLLLLLF